MMPQMARETTPRAAGPRSARARAATTVWLTGPPSSGKTTIAQALTAALRELGHDPFWVDGDELRQTVCRDLGFSREDRAENAQRAASLALGQAVDRRFVIVSLISPYAVDRLRVRQRHQEMRVRFIEVHVRCPPEIAERRDVKGLYRRARRGDLAVMTGVDDPYEPPASPEVALDTDRLTVEEEVAALLAHLGLRSSE